MSWQRIQHLIVGMTQLGVAIAAILELLQVIPATHEVNSILLTLLAAVSGANNTRKGVNGYSDGEHG